ncbi:Nucleic-acid-binding protein from transposon X-element [Labeo rohita]|uniref:Nucleic-acid-binding protein from transposon X-element n=1 Tax=Labeo rohita TaxID=84645 RepID=A0ABQ8L552_LABRO|nr:Nucleic-acid-binding protein from transposon X-element [Labeo rohita]
MKLRGNRAVRRKMCQEDDLRVLVKFKEGSDINDVGLCALTYGLKKALGDIEMAKILRDGRLLIKCKNIGQRDKALKIQSVCKKEVGEVRKFGEWGTKGVISGIPLGEKLVELRKVIKGGTVVSVKRLQANRNGEKLDSTSVLLGFKEQVLPERVMIGYMSFYVREYVPPPIRCNKCQRYGHIAKVCKGKQRCGKCGGEHEYGKCSDRDERKCRNCGGDHTAAYGGCPVRKRAVEVQQIRTARNLSYAEAVKSVERDRKEGGAKGNPNAR